MTKKEALVAAKEGRFEEITAEFWKDSEVIYEAFQKSHESFSYYAPAGCFITDKELMLKEIKEYPYAIENASKELLKDKKLIFEVAVYDEWALRLLPEKLYDDKMIANAKKYRSLKGRLEKTRKKDIIAEYTEKMEKIISEVIGEEVNVEEKEVVVETSQQEKLNPVEDKYVSYTWDWPNGMVDNEKTK